MTAPEGRTGQGNREPKIGDSAPHFFLPLAFAGGAQDRWTGLIRFGHRDYDPQSGRFTARDPSHSPEGDPTPMGTASTIRSTGLTAKTARANAPRLTGYRALAFIVASLAAFILPSTSYAECRIDLNCSNVDFIWIGETTDMHYKDGEIPEIAYAIVIEINQKSINIPQEMETCPEEIMHIFAKKQLIYEENTAIRCAEGFAFTRPTAQEAFAVAKMICAPKVHPVVRR